MSIKPEICATAINAKAHNWEENNLCEYMVIYIQTQTVSMSLYPHYSMLCRTICNPNWVDRDPIPPIRIVHRNINRVKAAHTQTATHLVSHSGYGYTCSQYEKLIPLHGWNLQKKLASGCWVKIILCNCCSQGEEWAFRHIYWCKNSSWDQVRDGVLQHFIKFTPFVGWEGRNSFSGSD